MTRSSLRSLLTCAATVGCIVFTASAANAQSPDWNAFLTVRPEPSPYIADWETDPSVVTLVLSYSGSGNVAFHLAGDIRRGASTILSGRSSAFEFVRPSQLLLTTRDGIWEPNSVFYDPTLSDQLQRTGRIPDGEYQFCVAVREGLPEAPGVPLTQECAEFSVTAPAPPSLLTPADGDTIFVPLPTFAWTPVSAGFNANLSYHLRIAEVLPNQSPLDAINGNTPQVEVDLPLSLYSYPQTELPLVDSAVYVWQVQALDAAGQPYGERQGKSEVFTFSMAGWTGLRVPIIARLPDTLTLIPGVARLRGLRGVDGAESATTYTLNGTVALDLLAPFEVEASVSLEDLAIDRAWLVGLIDGAVPADESASVVSGRLAGRLSTPAEQGGGPGYIRFNEVEYTAANGLALGGELLLPDQSPVPLQGRVRFANGSLSGMLTADAPPGSALLSFEDDPVRLDVRRVEAAFPSGAPRLAGALTLFGSEGSCDVTTGGVDAEGIATLDVNCAGLEGIRPLPGVEEVALALDSVRGLVQVDLERGELGSYQLEASGSVRLSQGGLDMGCGASFAMSLGNDGVSAESFGSRCDGTVDGGGLEWLGVRVSNLRLERLAYDSQQGFDVRLLLDVEPRVAAVPGFTLPTLVGVGVGTDGFVTPGVDVERAGARVDLLGFGFRVTRYRLPGFTLSWDDWRTGSPDGFRFAFDAELSLPDLAPTPTSCRSRPLTLTGVTLADGRLTGSLDSQVFDPACVLAFAPDLRLDVDFVGGAFEARLGEEVVLERTPEVGGSVILPPLFACADSTARRLELPGALLSVGAGGRLTGVVADLAPSCSVDLSAAQLILTRATLTFGAEGGEQSLLLAGDAEAVLMLAATPTVGTGSATIDVVEGRLVSGAVDFPGPLRLDLPREAPVLSFEIAQATLDSSGLRVDGRNRLLLTDGPFVNTTFERVTMDPESLSITAGRVLFETAFALEVGLDDAGALRWRAVSSGQDPPASVGLRADLPSAIALGPDGFTASGDGTARLVFGGQDLDGLSADFSRDFALGLDPVGVRRGMAEFRLDGDRVAFLNQAGLQPDLDFFADQLIPALLPLPTVAVAFATLRAENGDLLVRAENTDAGIRVFTPSSATVPVVVPALQRDGASPPSVLASFDVTLEPLGRRVSAGTIRATIPPGQQADFALAPQGPQLVRVTDLEYSSTDGLTLGGELQIPGGSPARLSGRAQVTALGVFGTLTAEAAEGGALVSLGDDPVRLRVTRATLELPTPDLDLVASLDLFEQELGCDGVTGRLTGDGLAATIACVPSRGVSLTSDTDRLRLVLRAVDGTVAADLASRQIQSHRITAQSEVHVDAPSLMAGADSASAATDPLACGATVELTVSDGAFSAGAFQPRCDPAEAETDLGWLSLRLSNFAVERLEYAPGSGFDFAFSLDAEASVPALPELDLPPLLGVVIGTDGLALPEIDAPLTTDRLILAGFGWRVTRVRLPAFTLAWSDWQARTPNGFRFGFEGDVTLPQLYGEAASCLAGDPILLSLGEMASGRVQLSLAERTYSPACTLPLAPELDFEVERVGGTLTVQIAPEPAVEETPEVEGALLLPSFFACSDPAAPRRLALAGNRLRLASDGRVRGSVADLAPPCPLDLAALQIMMTEASLDFSVAADTQSVVLTGAASGTFALASNPVSGSGQMAVDLVRGRMLSGSLRFPGPIRLDLPRERPVLSFLLNEATLDTAGLHIDGGQRLTLADGQNLDVSFEGVTINPQTLALTAGRVRFDTPFAFEVAIATDGALGWRAVRRNAALTATSGVRVDLPTQIALTPAGFTSTGDGGAHLRFGGRDVDSLSTRFSDDFALGLEPFGVTSGRADVMLAGESLAYIDRQGFRPNFAYFAEALLPARFGLPTPEIAYLQLRDEAGTLLVESESTGAGIRLRTRPGTTVPLVLPSLRLNGVTDPRLEVSFEVVLDELGGGVRSGSIRAAVPPDQRTAFDLSSGGLPVQIDTVSYEQDASSTYVFTLGGSLVLFGESAVRGGELLLTLDGTGRLTGQVAAELAQRVQLVPEDERLVLALSRVDGDFDASLGGGLLKHDLDLVGSLELAMASESRSVAATLHLSERGVSVTRIEARPGEGPAFLDAGVVRLGVTNVRVPRLEFAYQSRQWDFELLFDAELAFPALDSLVLPPVEDVRLTPSGVSVPAYAVPELDTDGFVLGDFPVRPLAFRAAAFAFDWFSGETASNTGFAFDLEVAFPPTAPAELREARLSILDAGYGDGGFTGTIEPRDLATPIRVPLGGGGAALDVRSLGGLLERDSVGAQVVSVTAGGSLVLPEYMRCDAEPEGDLPLPGAVFTLSSSGRIRGSASQALPQCPARIGPLTLQLATSELTFDVGPEGTQSAELFATATLRLPAPTAGDTVDATGDIGLDLPSGRITRGSIDVDSPFRWNLPSSGEGSEGVPLFTFLVRQGRIDVEGLHLTGSGQVEFYDWELVDVGSLGQAGGIADGTAEIEFENLTLGLPEFSISAGSVGFTQSFALDAGFEQGKPKWRSADSSQPRRPGPGARVTLPEDVSLSRDGLSLGGTAIAELSYGDRAFPELAVTFADDFLFGYDPAGVSRGRATFALAGSEIAYVDPTGFWPGDVFGVLPVPARVGLPSEDVAYLQLRDVNNQLLVESRTGNDGVSLRTRSGQSVQLVIPALADESGEPARADVQFDVTVNSASYQLVAGTVRVSAAQGGAPLFRLAPMPLEVREVTYQPSASGYTLSLDARLSLPASLGGVEVVFNDLLVGEAGLSGSAEVGRYTEHFDGSVAPLASRTLAENVDLDVLGARVTFSPDSADVRISGVLRTPLFSPPQGGPVAIFLAGAVGPSGLSLAIDPLSLPEGRLPISLVTFEPKAVGNEPPLRITATDQEFAVRMSGILRAPSLSADFAATIQGLEVGTRGIVLPSVSLTEPEEQQSFELFGATFTLRDSTGVYPAIAMDYTNGVLGLTMSGEVEFLDHAARFYGFRVTSAGAVSMAAANLLSAPVVLAENVLTLDSLGIRDSRLRAAFGVTLPAPLGEGGPQRVFVSVAPDGSVEGGGTVVVRNEAPGIGGERTQVTAGIVTLHPRYIGLQLDPTNVEASSVDVVADVYVRGAEANRIRLGDVAGGVVSPGLTVGFDGSVEWGNVSLERGFEFDFEAVRLTLSQVSAAGSGGRFEVSLSGELALNMAAVSGALGFTDVRIDDRGQMAFGSADVQGGELSVGGVVNLQVEGFAYSDAPTRIEVAGGTMPTASSAGGTGVETIDVASYIRFGGRIDVVDVLAGGVEEVLVYRTASDGRTGMVVRRASLDVYDVLSMQADLRYREIAGGFEMVLGAEGKLLQQYDVMLVGAIEQGNGTNRMGMFLATGVTIPIPAVPVVVISQLGGGFFYNPKPEYLDLVRQYAGVSQTAGEKIEAPAGKFAGLLYGAARITPAGVAEGRVLLTVMPTALQVDGAVTVLSQGNRLRGDAHLVLGLRKAYAEGNIAFTVDYNPVLDGAGQMEFYVYGPDVWGITGSTDVRVVRYFEGASEIFIGPPGFIVQVEVEQNFDIWILEINSDFETTAWYQRSAGDWGAHAAIRVKAELLGGALTARGTLQSALLFPGGGTPLMYAAGKVEGCVAGQCKDKRVWVRFKDGRVEDYGTGRNSELDDLLDEAQEIADEILAARDEAQEAAEQAQLTALSLSYEELAAAYRQIQGWSVQQFEWVAAQSTGIESQFAPQPGEGAQFGWYLGVLQQAGAPGDTTVIRSYADSVAARLSTIEAARGEVTRRISEITADIQSMEPDTDAPLPGTPVSLVSFSAPVTRTVVDAAGDTAKVLESGPSFEIDADAAAQVRSALDEWRIAAERVDQETRARLQEMETTLQRIRAVTSSADEGSLLSYARLYAEALTAAENQYATQADYILRNQDWMRARLIEQGPPELQLDALAATVTATVAGTTTAPRTTTTALSGATGAQTLGTQYASQSVYALVNRYTAIRSIITNKTRALRAESFERLRALIVYREALLDLWLGTNGARVAQFTAQEAQWGGPSSELYDQWADSTGMMIWYHLARAGMEDANVQADRALAELVTTADERLGGIRDRHGALSASLDRLYQGQAALTGVLRDSYDSYLLWRSETGDSAVSGAPGLATFVARKDALAQELEVPRLTGVQVTSLNAGYRATQAFQWSGSHPRGTYEFLFRDVAQGQGGLGAPLFSNGPAGSLTGHRFLPQRGWTEPARSFEVGVRGGAGFIGLGRADYTVTFQQQGGGTGASMTYVEVPDVTPPSIPVVEWVGSPARPLAAGGSEAWTARGDDVTARWSASDGESGISAYEFAVGNSPGDASIRDWQSAGGRSEMRLTGLPVGQGAPVFVSVRARNGRDLMGEIGASPGLRLDPTPPAFPAGASIAAGPMPDGATTPATSIALAACTVPEPAFPGAPVAAPPSRGVMAAPSSPDPWDGTLSRGGSVGLSSGGQASAAGAPARVSPRRSFSWPAAQDAESGLRAYYWRIDTLPATTFTESGWTAAPATQPSVTVIGEPLDYQRQFYVTMVAVNYAGLTTEPMSFGPFEVPDPTRPSTPVFCAGLGRTTDRLQADVTSPAYDPETRIVGYQYRVRTATQVIRDWVADALDWTELRSEDPIATQPLSLSDGQSYYLDVRSRNGDGLYGSVVSSGPAYYDVSPPPTPTVVALPDARRPTVLPLRITGAADPHSGFMTQHVAVGTRADYEDVVAWRNVPGATPGEYVVELPVSAALVAGGTYSVQIRTVNQAGLASAIYRASFVMPAPPPPTRGTGR